MVLAADADGEEPVRRSFYMPMKKKVALALDLEVWDDGEEPEVALVAASSCDRAFPFILYL
jgi:hypothetical protein